MRLNVLVQCCMALCIFFGALPNIAEAQKKPSLKVSEAELENILARARELGNSLKNAYGSDNPSAFAPELASHFDRPDLSLNVTRSQRKWKRRLKKIERRKRCRRRRKNKRNRTLALDAAPAAEQANCSLLCAWAAAWAEASCFAVACAECPGGTIRFCASFSARAYGYGVGVACVNACVVQDAPAEPECEVPGGAV